jgi:hypothetical protein
MCMAHQALLAALQESCDGFGPDCSLRLQQCPAGGQKWLAAAAALHHTWQQRVEALLEAFLDPNGSAQQQQQQQQQQQGEAQPSSVLVSSSTNASTGLVHQAASTLLAGIEAALCCWAERVLQTGLELQAAHTAAQQHEPAYQQRLARWTCILQAAAAATPAGSERSGEQVLKAMRQHTEELERLNEADEKRKEIAKEVQQAKRAWKAAAEAAEMLAVPVMQLLVLLQQDLLLDVLLSCAKKQQQQQGVHREPQGHQVTAADHAMRLRLA